MSTILDALKKSEQERKLNKLPTLSDMPPPQEPSRWPLILSAALVLVALALAVLAYVWWTSGSSQEPVSVASAGSGSSAEQSVIPSSAIDDSIVVNVVSYSDDVLERFAMVNGKMVREGEFVRAGLQVEEIRRNSVVLNLRGKRIIQGP